MAAEYRSPLYSTVTFAPAFSNSNAASTAEFLPPMTVTSKLKTDCASLK